MQKLKTAAVVLLVSLLTACQTVEQTAKQRAALACLSAGMGEPSPRHDECMRTVAPVAEQDERRRRVRNVIDALDSIEQDRRSRGL